jgi:PKD repeat protein
MNIFGKRAWQIIVTIVFGYFTGNLNSQVVADFDFNQDCNVVQFNDLSATSGLAIITGYLWNFGDGTTSILQDPQHTYLVEDSYTVEIRVYYSDGGEDDSASAFYPIHYYLPVASFAADDVCFGVFTEFLSEATTGLNTVIDPDYMVWDFENNGVFTDTGSMVTHVYDAPGQKTVLFHVTNSIGCMHDTIQYR